MPQVNEEALAHFLTKFERKTADLIGPTVSGYYASKIFYTSWGNCAKKNFVNSTPLNWPDFCLSMLTEDMHFDKLGALSFIHKIWCILEP